MRLCTGHRHKNIPPVSILSAGICTVIILALRSLFLLVLSLGNGIGIGFPTLSTKSNKCVLDSTVILPQFETVGKGSAKCLPKVTHGYAVLGTPWTGQAGFDRAKIKFEQVIELRLKRVVCTEEPLGPGIAFDKVHQFRVTPGAAQIAERLGIYRKEGRCCAKLRGHIRDGGAVCEWELTQSRTGKLDKLGNDATLA